MKIEKIIIKYANWIISISIIIVLASIYPITKTTINPDLESYLPDSMDSRKNTKLIGEIFGDNEPIIIIFETDDVLNESTLERIENLSREFNNMREFDRVYSLFDAVSIKGDDGFMKVDPVISRIPSSENRREKLRNEIIENELVYNLIVSEDFRYTMIMLSSNRGFDDNQLMEYLFAKLEEFSGDETVNINAQAYMRNEANNNIGRDLMILLPIGLLLMFLFLVISFKEKRGVVLPLSIVMIAIIISMSLLSLFGWELSLIGILIPIMMIAIANNYGIHVISKYQELNSLNPEMSMNEIVIETISYLKKPVIITGLTTIAGILGLVTHILLPASQMGVITAISIGFALILSLIFIPAGLSKMKKGKPLASFRGEVKGFIPNMLQKLGLFVSNKPKTVIILFAIFLVFAAAGLFKFQIASDSNKVLPDNHSFNVAMDIADENFGGIKMIQILFNGDIKEPELLKRMDYYTQELKKMPEIGNINSIATIIREMSKALNDEGDEFYDKIPDSYQAVAQYLELYAMSGDPEDFEEFVDFNFENAILTIQYKANDLESMNRVINKIEELTKNDPNYVLMGGYSLIDKELSQAVVKGQNFSLIFAFIVIFILVAIIFKSVFAGLFGSFPLFFAILCTFGFMGWFGIELNIVTALLSSISIGLGVDYTIHMFWRLKSEIQAGNNHKDAVKNSISTIGRGITINAFSVILGFSVLLLSAFPIVKSFAFLIIISIFLCLICAMILIPALCIVLKPKFLE